MTAERDVLWADLLQFDPPSADQAWDGDLRDPDAPDWYADLGSLIHRARGPAEPDELADEPELVATMRRASLGAAIVALPRHRGVRSVGRVVAMKAAAAATTVSMVGVAAAATTGIVATVAATVVVPAISEKVRPVIEAHIVPVEPTGPPSSAQTSTPSPTRRPVGAECRLLEDVCADPSAPVIVDLPACDPGRLGAGGSGRARYPVSREHNRSADIDRAADHDHRRPVDGTGRAGTDRTRRRTRTERTRRRTRTERTDRRPPPRKPTADAPGEPRPPAAPARAERGVRGAGPVTAGYTAEHGDGGGPDEPMAERRRTDAPPAAVTFPSTRCSASAHREFRA